MKVEVLFGGMLWSREFCKGGGRGDHQERQGLWAVGGETLFLAILDMICIDAIDGVQQLRVLWQVRSCHAGGQQRSR